MTPWLRNPRWGTQALVQTPAWPAVRRSIRAKNPRPLLGLDLGLSLADVIRAVLEGIALNLRLAVDELRHLGESVRKWFVVGEQPESAVAGNPGRCVGD